LVTAVFSAENGREALGKVVRYALLANQRTTIQDLESVLVPMLGEAAREVVMTEGERLIQQGELRGLEKGEAKGRAEGEAKGRAASVLAFLSARGMKVSADQRKRIESCADIPSLDRWIVRAATAPTIDEVFADD
jgi:predicted transposase YdaD